MRTPGHDRELAVGFLFTEGILDSPDQVAKVEDWGPGNVVRVELSPGVEVDLARLERHSTRPRAAGSAARRRSRPCASAGRPIAGRPPSRPRRSDGSPRRSGRPRGAFDRTGGLHAAALFDTLRQADRPARGRRTHNALDKLIGASFLAGRTPLPRRVLLVSGRASFELVQKAAVAGIPVLAAVGAPSSLAVELARHHGMTCSDSSGPTDSIFMPDPIGSRGGSSRPPRRARLRPGRCRPAGWSSSPAGRRTTSGQLETRSLRSRIT